MLFVLNEDLAGLVMDNNQEATRVVNDLCVAVRYGFHSFFADRKVLDSLIKCENLHKESRGIVNHLLSSYSFSFGIRNNVQLLIELNNERQITVDNTGGKTQIGLPISTIKDNSLFQQTELLLENIVEKDLYVQMAKYYCSKVKIGFPARTNLRVIHGGGNTTDIVFKKELSEKRSCLCICDSDSKYPGCELGETAKKVVGIDTSQWPMCKVITTAPYREIENLIPYQRLVSLTKHNGDIKKAVMDYNRIIHQDHTHYRHIDIKEGITIGSWYKSKNAFRLYLDELLLNSNLISTDKLERLRQLSPEQIDERSAESLIHPSGGNILTVYLDNRGYDEVHDKDFLEGQERLWFSIGKCVFEWGFSMGKVSI